VANLISGFVANVHGACNTIVDDGRNASDAGAIQWGAGLNTVTEDAIVAEVGLSCARTRPIATVWSAAWVAITAEGVCSLELLNACTRTWLAGGVGTVIARVGTIHHRASGEETDTGTRVTE
jgi:hypothetical protein